MLLISGPGLPGSVSAPVGLLLGFAQLLEVRCKPGLVVVVSAEGICLHTQVLTEANV